MKKTAKQFVMQPKFRMRIVETKKNKKSHKRINNKLIMKRLRHSEDVVIYVDFSNKTH